MPVLQEAGCERGAWFGLFSQPALGFLFWFVFLEEQLSEELGARGKC